MSVSGIGLHTGVAVKLCLRAAPANRGIVFRRTDLEGFEIEARARNVARVSYATSLMRKGVLISTTEHLLSALAACGVDNAYVDIDNLEVPILDGSALPFVRLIQKAGIKRQRAWRVYARLLRPVEVVEGEKRIAAYPSERSSEHFAVNYRIVFPHPVIGEQFFEYVQSGARLNGHPSRYETEIAPARTFGFLDEVERLRQSGLVRGGSLENAVVLTCDGVMNPEGLRFPDEFCRHKILDLIGDMSLFGHPVLGRIVAERAGHAMHAALVAKLLRERNAWELTSPELGASSRTRASGPVAALTAVDGTA